MCTDHEFTHKWNRVNTACYWENQTGHIKDVKKFKDYKDYTEDTEVTGGGGI